MLICKKCGAKLPASCVFCLICGTKAGESPLPEPEISAPVTAGQTEDAATIRNKHSKRLITVCVSICALLILSTVSLYFVQALPYLRSSGKTRAKGAIIYVTSDEKLKFKTPNMDTPEEITSAYRAGLNESGSNLAKSSASGRYIAYLNEYFPADGTAASGQLFLRDYGNATPLDAAEPSASLIAENVTDTFFFTDNSTTLVYLTETGELYANNYENSWLLDTGVTEVIDHKDSRILYAKTKPLENDTTVSSVYLCPNVNGSGEKILIDSDILNLADYTPGLEQFIYLRVQPDNTREVIAYDTKLNSHRTLAVGVDKLIAADALTSAILYQTKNLNTLSYESLITDDSAAADKNIKEPDIEDYPLLKQLNERELDEDSPEALEESEDLIDSEDLVDEIANFQEATDAYNAKLERDAGRTKLKIGINAFVAEHPVTYSLYLGLDGAPVRIADGSYLDFENATLDTSNRFAIWSLASFRGLKKIPLTQYAQTLSGAPLKDFLNEKVTETLYFRQFDNDSVPLYVGEGTFHVNGWQLASKGSGIYFALVEESPFLSQAENACALYYAPIKNNSAESIVLIDEKVAGIAQMLDGNRLLYYKELVDGICDLYALNGSSGERIGDDVTLLDEFFKIKNDGKTLLYCENFSSSTQSGDLLMLTKQKRQLTTGVHRIFYRNDGLVYFLQGFKDGKSDLYSFSGDGLVRIDENVVAVME